MAVRYSVYLLQNAVVRAATAGMHSCVHSLRDPASDKFAAAGSLVLIPMRFMLFASGIFNRH